MAFQLLSQLYARRNFLRLVSLLVKACIFLPLPLFCQSVPVSSVSIPFAFSAGNHIFPAGDYILSRSSDHIYGLRPANGTVIQSFLVFDSATTTPHEKSKLVFWNYGGHYFLASFWTGGSQSGFQVRTSRAEKEMLAATKSKPSTGILMALDMRGPGTR